MDETGDAEDQDMTPRSWDSTLSLTCPTPPSRVDFGSRGDGFYFKIESTVIFFHAFFVFASLLSEHPQPPA